MYAFGAVPSFAQDGRGHLVASFSAADILMVSVPRILRHTDLLEHEPALLAYKQHCEERPAFARALTDQMAAFGARGVHPGDATRAW